MSDPSRFQGAFQALEDRRMLTVFTVDTLVDDASGLADGLVSFREAMIAAETNASFGDAAAGEALGDSIVFANSLDGMTIDISSNGQFQVSDDLSIGDLNTFVTIDGGGASRIINIDSTESFTLTNFRMTDGDAIDFGGAILMSGGGSLSLVDMQLDANIAGISGGGLFSDESTISIEDSRFENNSVNGADGNGGAIGLLEGTFSMTGSTVIGNAAVTAGGGISMTGSMASIVDTELNNNAVSAGIGGAVAMLGGANLDLAGTFVGANNASVSGGGFYVSDTGRLIVKENSTINGNTASGSDFGDGGGGIYNAGGLVRVLDSTISNNTADGTSGAGGGVLSASGVLNIRRSVIASNTAAAFGGGIQVGGGFARLEASTLGGPDAMDANFAGTNAALGDGGGLHVSGGLGTVVEIDGTQVTRNDANRDGGALWNRTGAIMVISNMSFIDNNSAGSEINGGGGIFNNGGTVVIDNSTVTMNRASGAKGLGGGVHSLGGLVIVTGSSINFNQAVRAGGGVSMIGGTLSTTDSNIASNTANDALADPGNGGGINAADAALVILDSTSIASNTAANVGGGIAAFDSTVVVRNASSVATNGAGSQVDTTLGGGGIFAQDTLLRILDSVVSGNVATGADSVGGGIAVEGGRLLARDSDLLANIAAQKGGGVYVGSAIATFRDSVVGGGGPSDANTAADGAGIYFDGTSIGWVNGSSISYNIATQEGGGIFNHPNSHVRISDGAILSFNSADSGGAIYNAGLMSIEDSRLISNMARVGGGLSNQPLAIVVVETADIDGNQATLVGGGVQNAGIVSFTMMGEVKNNQAAAIGGGIYTDSIGTTYIGDLVFSGNLPDDMNGG